MRHFILKKHFAILLAAAGLAAGLTGCVMRRGSLVSTDSSEDTAAPAMKFTAVRAQRDASCAIRDDQTLWCWGFNNRNALGLGDDDAVTHPLQVGPLTEIVDVAPAEDHTCALRADHSLFCVGRGGKGQLGDGTSLDRGNFVQVPGSFTSVATASGLTCATAVGDVLMCWGDSDAARRRQPAARPMKVEGGEGVVRVLSATIAQRQDGSAWTYASVAREGDLSCEVRADGTLWCAGGEVAKSPIQMGRVKTWVAVAAGGEHACALRLNGAVYCFGANMFGQLGVGRGALDVPYSHELLPVFTNRSRSP